MTPSGGSGRKALNGYIRTPVIRVVVGDMMSAFVGVQRMEDIPEARDSPSPTSEGLHSPQRS